MSTAFRPSVVLLALMALSIGVLSGCQDPGARDTTQVTPIESTTDKVTSGQSVYESNCASCHGVTGSGASSMVLERQVAFNNPDWQKRYTDAQLVGIIKDGKGMMPAFGSSISDAELKTLVAYIRTLDTAKP